LLQYLNISYISEFFSVIYSIKKKLLIMMVIVTI